MLVSTRGRYALRVMIDLASQPAGEYVPLLDIAQRQEISEKYLESIVGELSKAGLVDSHRGKGGGYRLNKDPGAYSVLSVVECTDGSLAPVSCLGKNAKQCPRAAECKTVDMWTELYSRITDYLQGVTIEDLINKGNVIDYVI